MTAAADAAAHDGLSIAGFRHFAFEFTPFVYFEFSLLITLADI